MKMTRGLLIVMLCAVSLAGCIRATGPCYGVGCHAFTTPSGSQAQSAAAPAPPAQNSQAASSRRKSKAPQKRHGLHALLKKVKL
jgi:hypothetical protein